MRRWHMSSWCYQEFLCVARSLHFLTKTTDRQSWPLKDRPERLKHVAHHDSQSETHQNTDISSKRDRRRRFRAVRNQRKICSPQNEGVVLSAIIGFTIKVKPILTPEPPVILVDGVRVAAVDKTRAALYIGCPKLVERLLWTARHCPADRWIKIVHNASGKPKAKTLIDARSLECAYARISAGEEPPFIKKLR